MILSDTAILIYLSVLINNSISQNAIDTLGAVLYSLANLGDISGVIQISIPVFVYVIPNYIPAFIETKISLLELRNNFTNYDFQWNNCEDPKVLFENEIPYYNIIKGTKQVEMLNMFNIINNILVIVTFT